MTNGLVSVRVNGSVVLKIIAGSDGMNAVAVADAIKKMTKVPGPNEAYDLAIRLAEYRPQDGSPYPLTALPSHLRRFHIQSALVARFSTLRGDR
jgi:hypothetical protein